MDAHSYKNLRGEVMTEFNDTMQKDTCIELYDRLVETYGKDRVRLVVEVMPKAIIKTIDEESTAQKTLARLQKQ